MLTMMFTAILFILFITFFLGLWTGKSVPDEIMPAKKYLVMGSDMLLLSMLCVAVLGFGKVALAIALPIFLLLLRSKFTFDYLYAPVSGIVLAAGPLLSNEVQIIVFVLCLVMNFLLGAIAKKRSLLWILQPALGLLAALW